MEEQHQNSIEPAQHRSRKLGIILLCAMLLVAGILFAIYRPHLKSNAGSPELFSSLIAEYHYLSSNEGTAMQDYARAVHVLEARGLNSEVLNGVSDKATSMPAGGNDAIDRAIELVIAGASRKIPGIKIANNVNVMTQIAAGESLSTHLEVNGGVIKMNDLMLPCRASVIRADEWIDSGDTKNANRLLSALFVMGTQIAGTKEPIMDAISIGCKQSAAHGLKRMAESSRDAATASACDALLSDLEREFQLLKDRQ